MQCLHHFDWWMNIWRTIEARSLNLDIIRKPWSRAFQKYIHRLVNSYYIRKYSGIKHDYSLHQFCCWQFEILKLYVETRYYIINGSCDALLVQHDVNTSKHHRFFHFHHHEIPLCWANHSYCLPLAIGSFNPSICSLYWSQLVYHQHTTLQTLSWPTQVLWGSSIHHYPHWHATSHSSYWIWKGWECCPGYQNTSGCQEPLHLSPNHSLSP